MDLSSYLDLFVAEAREHIVAASELASAEGERAEAADGLRELFRHVHSIKGMAASMGFGAMSALAHDAESLMDDVRQGHLAADRHTRRILGDALNCLERMVDRAESKQEVDDGERAPLQERLKSVLRGTAESAADGAATSDPGGSARAVSSAAANAPAGCVKLSLIVGRQRAFPAVRAAVVLGQIAKLGRMTRIDPPMAALRSGRFDGRLQVILVSKLSLRAIAAKIAGLEDVDSFTLVPAEAPPEKVAPQSAKALLRVRADLLDGLIDDVLELMSSVGRIDSVLRTEHSGSRLSREAESARLLTRRAYDGLVEMRLVPFEIAAHRLRRTADELSRKLGKNVGFEMDGENVRVDRSLLERLIDPLVHMVRNAVDHGIEPPEARKAARKPAAGRLHLHVERHASRLSIVLEDDGRGLDPRHLKQVAIERGCLTPGEAVRLSDRDALLLITEPGFSTVEETTEVSGRGVGMDVVKTAVEAIGGRLRIESRAGRGTRFELALPASVALVQTYIVRTSGMAFAVPLSALTRMAPIDDHTTTWRDGRRFVNLGADEVPVWSLREVLGLAHHPAGAGGMALIGESAGGAAVGIEVDEVVGKREVVVRPLPLPLSSLLGYSGAAVLDDGSIVLVLDPANLPLG
jgi:two-component system, chemotaxis family, sensor kinase CheA